MQRFLLYRPFSDWSSWGAKRLLGGAQKIRKTPLESNNRTQHPTMRKRLHNKRPPVPLATQKRSNQKRHEFKVGTTTQIVTNKQTNYSF